MMAGWAPLLNSLMSVPDAVSNILIKVPCNDVNKSMYFFLVFLRNRFKTMCGLELPSQRRLLVEYPESWVPNMIGRLDGQISQRVISLFLQDRSIELDRSYDQGELKESWYCLGKGCIDHRGSRTFQRRAIAVGFEWMCRPRRGNKTWEFMSLILLLCYIYLNDCV